MSKNRTIPILLAVFFLLLLSACERGEKEDRGEKEEAATTVTWEQALAKNCPLSDIATGSSSPIRPFPSRSARASRSSSPGGPFRRLEKVLKAVDATSTSGPGSI